MPPVGRPQLPRGSFSIQDTAIAVPDRVLLDTSFVVEALVLLALPSECVEVETVIPQVHALMGGCGLASYDAVHVATAIQARTRAVVTLDAGFAAAPASAIDVYIDNSRLASCRGRRGR